MLGIGNLAHEQSYDYYDSLLKNLFSNENKEHGFHSKTSFSTTLQDNILLKTTVQHCIQECFGICEKPNFALLT